MSEKLTIGKAARLTGVPAKTIRFYEEEGLIPRARRTDSGYRLYSDADVARLQLVRKARLLGIDLASIKSLLDRALGESCAAFGEELNALLDQQRIEIDRRLAELSALRNDLDALQSHLIHCCEGCDPDQMASECNFCGLISLEKGGASDAND